MTYFFNRLKRLLWREQGASLPEPVAFPPPYKAMLAINSDVEWTRWHVQLGLMRELAERDLETAFSFWLFSSPEVTWRVFHPDGTPTEYADAAFALARAGFLDTNHAIGGRKHISGCKYDREAIARAYTILATNGVTPRIFSNHGSTMDKQNVAGDWGSYQEGDVPTSPYYHLDLTINSGVSYFWTDQDYRLEPTAMTANVGTADGLFLTDKARDGRRILRFLRYMGTLPQGCSLDNFGIQIDQVLDAGLPGYTVLYQHLGVERKPNGKPDEAHWPPLKADAARGLDRLAEAQKRGDILVTTSARLLDHAALMTARPWKIRRAGSGLEVDFETTLNIGGVELPLNWDGLQGWAIPLGTASSMTARLGGETRVLTSFDVSGERYAGFPWQQRDMHGAIAEAEALTNPATNANSRIPKGC